MGIKVKEKKKKTKIGTFELWDEFWFWDSLGILISLAMINYKISYLIKNNTKDT